jgi:hypothetical protein
VQDLEARLSELSRLMLAQRYPQVVRSARSRAGLSAHEWKLYSQNGEDGILAHVFQTIGVVNWRFVEFGFGDGRQCNAANLALNCGWRGLFLDGNEHHVLAAKAYYASMLGPRYGDVRMVHAWITAENINAMLASSGFDGEIDLLSIDIDGNDYWVWRAIDVIQPRVVIVEYNATFGPTRAVTTKYDPEFRRYGKHASGYYHGASLSALTKLGKQKGYRLVGCETSGANAFFLRKGIAEHALPAVTPEEAYHPLASREGTPVQQFEQISELELDQV